MVIHHRKVYISIDGYRYMAKKVNLKGKKLLIEDEIELLFEKVVTKFGTSAKLDVPKKYIGKTAYVMIQK